MTGFVYAILCGEFVKIGWSRDPWRRLSKIRSDVPHPCELIATIPGTKETESAYHRRFEAHRHNREWFRFSEEIQHTISFWPPHVRAPWESDATRQRIAKWLTDCGFEVTDRKKPLTEFATRLGISKGSASSVITGKRRIGPKLARRMGRITGRPWHEFISPESNSG